MASWENNGFTYEFSIAENQACICRIKIPNGITKISIPAEVQYNGITYPVTAVEGHYHLSPRREIVTDKRRKNYGEWEFAGYNTFKAPVLCDNNYYDTQVTDVILPKTLRRIGPYSFTRCKALENIVLNKGLEEIKENAFEYCQSLKNLTIPSTVKKIGSCCFSGGTSISLKIQNKQGSVEFENGALGSDDKVEYVGKSFFSRLFNK